MTQEERVLNMLRMKGAAGIFKEQAIRWGLNEFPAITCVDRILRRLAEEGKAYSVEIENHKTKKWFYLFKEKDGQGVML
jgi:hypothetical protein